MQGRYQPAGRKNVPFPGHFAPSCVSHRPASLENLRGTLLGAGVKAVEIVEYDRRYELN